MNFNGFISYSHAADGRLAPAVQRGLHRLAKPWHRRRALWIFRDQTGLSVTPGLWSSIQQALDGSEYFVLLASPEAAQSRWVNREIEHWVANKPADRILPVVTDGQWAWDRDRRDFTLDSTAVPWALRGVFAEEPLFLDLRWARGGEHLSLQHSRFRDAIAQLAAPMHGVSKDELEGEDVRQHRRVRRLRSGAVATLTVLALVASLTGVLAVRNAGRANESAAEARRQQLAAMEQRGSAQWFAAEAGRQQETARQEQARAQEAANLAERQEKLADEQQALADEAAAEAGRQQRIADRAAWRTREQQRLARDAAERARKLAAKARELAAEARRLAEVARKLARLAQEQQRRAQEAAAEALRQQSIAERQQRIAVSRRLINQARADIVADPRTALMLAAAAQTIQPDAETKGGAAGVVTSTHFAGAVDDVSAAAFAPDGVLATIDDDGGVSLWDVRDRRAPKRLSTFRDPGGAVPGSTVFTPDGRTLAMVARNGDPVLWNVADRSHPVRYAALDNDAVINALAFAPNGRIAATADNNGRLHMWDVADRSRPRRLTPDSGRGRFPMVEVTFAADGRTVATADAPAGVPQIYDVTDPSEPVHLMHLPTVIGGAIAFSPAGSYLALTEPDGTVGLWDPSLAEPRSAARASATGAADDDDDGPQMPPPLPDDPDLQLSILRGLSGTVGPVAFSRDGRKVAAADGHGTAVVWDLTEPTDPRVLTTLTARSGIGTVSFSPDGGTVATTDATGTATLWNVPETAAPDRLARLTHPAGQVLEAGFAPDGRSLMLGGADGRAEVWRVTDPAHPARTATAPVFGGTAGAVAFSADRRTVAAGSETAGTTLTDLTDPARPATVATIAGGVRGLALSPDARTLAAVTADGSLAAWNLADRAHPRPLGSAPAGAGVGRRMAVSPDGRTVATAGGDRKVVLWDVGGGPAPVRLSETAGHSAGVTAVAFSPDGRTLVTGSQDQTAIVWDVTDRARPHRLAALTGHERRITSVTFSADGRMVATAAEDRTAIVWDASARTAPVRLARLAHDDWAMTARFSPDGRTLAVVVDDDAETAVALWSLADLARLRADPAGYACDVAGRGLTRDEWRRHVPELAYLTTC